MKANRFIHKNVMYQLAFFYTICFLKKYYVK